jgi:hypothetical protein
MDNRIALSLVHLFVVVPLFLYVGFKRADNPLFVYNSLLAIGFVILGYHGYKLYLRRNSSYAWVNAFHIALIAPLLLYIGYNKKQTPRAAYEMMLIAGFAAGGYHLFSLVRSLNTY